MPSILDAPEIWPIANACMDQLLVNGRVAFADIPPELGLTEDLFTTIMDEISAQVNTGRASAVH